MREKKLAFYQTEVRRVFCPSPRPTSWQLAQTEIERLSAKADISRTSREDNCAWTGMLRWR
jgi:hypothetical protein